MATQNETKKLADYLPEIINATRKARCEAERRHLEMDALVNHANVWYACISATLSTLALFANGNTCLQFLSFVSAIILAFVIIYATARDHKSKAAQMKLCYTELQNLLFRLDHLATTKPTNYEEQILQISNEYTAILKRYENHLPRDYQKAKWGVNRTDCPTREMKKFHIINRARYYLLRLAVYFGPILLALLLIFLAKAFGETS